MNAEERLCKERPCVGQARRCGWEQRGLLTEVGRPADGQTSHSPAGVLRVELDVAGGSAVTPQEVTYCTR